MSEERLVEIGRITHYFANINVAVVELSDSLAVGDTIAIKGSTTDFEQVVKSMQIEHESVTKVDAGQSIGLKVQERVRTNDSVYKKQ
ncbi:MAG: translation elongation factor-like protein [Candidatus Bathyarchaeota archaeon]